MTDDKWKYATEEEWIKRVSGGGAIIMHCPNKTEAICRAAVQKDGYAIKSISNTSEAVKLAAVQQNGCAIRYIKNPSEEIQLAAIQQNGYAITYIKNPSDEIIELAFNSIINSGWMIQEAIKWFNQYNIQLPLHIRLAE